MKARRVLMGLLTAVGLTVVGAVIDDVRANTFSATASAGPTGVGCFGSDSVGGSGFTSASIGPISCAFLNPFFGGVISSTASASGSWVTGDFSASAVAAANPGSMGHGNSISATGSNMFTVNGLVTLPSGMTSAPITFGVTGLSGTVGGGPLATSGGFSSGDIITLMMSAGGSSGTSGTSVACLTLNLFSSSCPGSGLGLQGGLGPGALAPITLTVNNGDTLQLTVSVQSTGFANAFVAPESASADITVDPLFLTLPAGATFDSGIPDFLSGPPASTTPEPATWLLLGSGLVALALARRKSAA